MVPETRRWIVATRGWGWRRPRLMNRISNPTGTTWDKGIVSRGIWRTRWPMLCARHDWACD